MRVKFNNNIIKEILSNTFLLHDCLVYFVLDMFYVRESIVWQKGEVMDRIARDKNENEVNGSERIRSDFSRIMII